MFENSTKGAAQRAEANRAAPNEFLGEAVHKTKNMLVAVYDFSVLGGAVGSINLVDDAGNAALLPVGAVVTEVICAVLTTVTSGGSATISCDLLVAADLMAATAKASLVQTAGSQYTLGKPVMSDVSKFVGPVSAVGGSNVAVTVGTAAVTAGKIKYFIQYFIQ
jgi:hypothetical protein